MYSYISIVTTRLEYQMSIENNAYIKFYYIIGVIYGNK